MDVREREMFNTFYIIGNYLDRLEIALICLRNLEPIVKKILYICFKTNAGISFSIRTLLSSDYVSHSTLG